MTETKETLKKPELWHEGPNYAADAVVINDEKLLLIQRSDTHEWALPGGFKDDDEHPIEAARREVFEETGLIVIEEGISVYSGPVIDPRNSSDRWIETDAYLFSISTNSEVAGKDDAEDASWFELDSLPEPLYGSHAEIIERARLLRALEKGEPEPTRGGHMSYDYSLLHTESHGPLFAKRHVPARHEEPRREASSRAYLQKEATTFAHLRRLGYSFIPSHSTLYEDSLLIIEGLPESHGWLWRAPSDERLGSYIQGGLNALESLETASALPESDDITPSIVTFYEEGWEDLSKDENLAKVSRKIAELCDNLHPATDVAAKRLSPRLQDLRSQASHIDLSVNIGLSHHDARQANMAWHPVHGTKLVDWSWAGPGVRAGDTTSFLIDVAKSGHDVGPWLDTHFNPDHALLLIGFWLGHSIWPSKAGNEKVRLHQVASAATAYQLLTDFADRGSTV